MIWISGYSMHTHHLWLSLVVTRIYTSIRKILISHLCLWRIVNRHAHCHSWLSRYEWLWILHIWIVTSIKEHGLRTHIARHYNSGILLLSSWIGSVMSMFVFLAAASAPSHRFLTHQPPPAIFIAYFSTAAEHHYQCWNQCNYYEDYSQGYADGWTTTTTAVITVVVITIGIIIAILVACPSVL